MSPPNTDSLEVQDDDGSDGDEPSSFSTFSEEREHTQPMIGLIGAIAKTVGYVRKLHAAQVPPSMLPHDAMHRHLSAAAEALWRAGQEEREDAEPELEEQPTGEHSPDLPAEQQHAETSPADQDNEDETTLEHSPDEGTGVP